MFTDTHCHLTLNENIEQIIFNAKQNGITKIINNGTNYQNNLEVLNISLKYENIYASLGYHPEDIKDYKIEQLNLIKDNINKIVAIGEIGLDYHYTPFDKNKQIELFKAQLAIADIYHKPAIIHTRDAIDDTISILKEFPTVKGVIHCFTGTLEQANAFIDIGFKLGIGGIVTFSNSNLAEIVKDIPLNSIVLETDSPYLAPVPNRGKRNEPANITYIAKRISEIKNITLEELYTKIEQNVREVFDI